LALARTWSLHLSFFSRVSLYFLSFFIEFRSTFLTPLHRHSAIISTQTALEVEPSNNDWKLLLAEVYEALGETQKAIDLTNEVNRTTKALDAQVQPQPFYRKRQKDGGAGKGKPKVPKKRAGGEKGNGADVDLGDDMSLVAHSYKSLQRLADDDPASLAAKERMEIQENRELWNKMRELIGMISDHVKRVSGAMNIQCLLIF
jgi:hypothetical protein